MSDAIPHLHEVADDLCVIRSMNTDQFNHAPAELLLYTGSPRPGRPSMGTWVTYGLGTENENLPGFVVLISSGVQPSGGQGCWGSGFLPSVFQGVQCRSQGRPGPLCVRPAGHGPRHAPQGPRRAQGPERVQAKELGHPETLTRIQQYELAFRMQTSVPEVMDLSKEDKKTIEMYGATPGGASFANNCLLARRLVEQGVRFVQLFDWGWDFHGTGPSEEIKDGLTKKGATMSQPVAALIKDLKRKGLFDSTLVVLGGRVRPHAVPRGPDGRQQAPGPRPLPGRLLAGPGRGGRQGRVHARRRRTTWASRWPRTRCTCTTCRRRSCTSSASTTRG